MQIEMRLTGARSLAKQFDAMRKASQRATVTRAARAAARLIGEEARRRAPRAAGGPTYPDKGHAYRTIRWLQVEKWPHKAVFAIGPTDWGYYLIFHEVGTYKMPARPWLRPALDAMAPQAVQEAGDVFREAVVAAAMRARERR